MIIKKALIIFCCLSFISSQNLILSQGNSFEKLFLIASKSRPIDAQDVLQRLDSANKERQTESLKPEVEAGKEIWLTSQDFTVNNDLTSSIIRFIGQSVGGQTNDLFCVNPSRTHTKKSVFLTKDYAVKVFPHAEQSFHKIVAEISGLDILRKLKLHEGKTAEFIAVGKCVINGEGNFLLLMRRVPGKPVRHYLNAIFTSSEPQFALNECKHILAQLGRLLGEMHVISSRKANPKNLNHALEKHQRLITKYLKEYEAVGGEDSTALRRFFADVLTYYDTKTVYLTIFHNDAHLENFLFDQDAGMTVIDTPRVHYTVNARNQPLFSSYAHDVARVEDDIAKCVLYHEYNENLIIELQEAFRMGYVEKAAHLINPSQFFADKAVTMLSRLKSVVSNRFEPGPNERIYQYYSNFFKTTSSEPEQKKI